MIPYVQPPFPVFFPLVGAGILAAHLMLLARARREGLDERKAGWMSFAMVAGGFAGGHWFKLLYLPESWTLVRDHPWVLLLFPAGLASFGGLAGGIGAGAIYLGAAGAWPERWKYLDSVAAVFPFGWVLGRLGCALVHDHRGIRSSHWLAVNFPDGGRFDLGLLELLYMIPVAAAFHQLGKRPRPEGFFLATFLVPYGILRIVLDRLHEYPPKYWGATPDQWGGAFSVIAGMWSLYHWKRRAL